MVLNKTQTKRMLRMKRQIEAWIDGELKGIVPYVVDDCILCYNSILHSVEHKGVTICEDSKNIYQKMGFEVAPYGIGWEISIK